MGLRQIWSKEPIDLLGKSLVLTLKQGGIFHFKTTEAGADWIGGFDDEGLNLRISINDIEDIREA